MIRNILKPIKILKIMKSIKRFYAAFIAFLLMSGFACAQNIFPANGNIGVGTLNPTVPLFVKKSSMGLDLKKPANYGFAVSEQGSYVTGVHIGDFGYDKSGVIQTWNQRLSLNPLGNNVGIGTMRPATTLDVAGTTRTHIVEITGGSDLAEPFEVPGADVQPGMVVSIDPELPGQLRVSNTAYDHTVAGIISGANGLKPGLTMKQEGSIGDGSHPVALTGRVYCWADASQGAIQAGDLLTTSSLPGHAMKVSDYAKAQGAIIGKAMSALEKGKGLVLVLVSLQ